MLIILVLCFILVSCDDLGLTSLFDCQQVSFHEIYSRDITQYQKIGKMRFQTSYPPYGVVDVNNCRISKYSSHEFQYVAINAVNGYRTHVGLSPANFDCVGTVVSDPVALYLYANGDANPPFTPMKKCYYGVSQNLFVDSIKVRKQRKENTDGKLVFKIVDELIEGKGDTHLVARRKLLDYRLKDFVASAIGGKNDNDYVYYTFVTTSRTSMENDDGFTAYPPPGYANINWIKGPMSFHHYKITANVKMSIKDKAGKDVSFTMSLDPLNDTYINPGISFTFKITLKEKYTINVHWTNKDEKFNFTYGFFAIDDNTKPTDLSIKPCDITNPPYNPVEAAGTSVFNCRTLSYSPLYKRSLNDLLNRYLTVYGNIKTKPTTIVQSKECDLDHSTEEDKQDRGLEVFNFYRYYVGAPEIGYNPTYQSSCDESGIFSLVNNVMEHYPTSGKCYSEDVVKCLGESNLAKGYETIEEAYTGWMIDKDSASVGHRRYMMYPYLNGTTISALQIGANTFYVQRTKDYNSDVQGVSPFYAYPPPGFVIKDISPSLTTWNSFHHTKIKDDNLKVKVVDQLGGDVMIKTSKDGLTNNQPLPCILWQFYNEPMIGKQYTITVSWRNLGVDFIFNYTIIYVNLDTKVTIKEPTQCGFQSNSALFDCEVVSNHTGYSYDYEKLKNTYNTIMNKLPSKVDDFLTLPEYNPSSYSNFWKIPERTKLQKGKIISEVMFELLNLIRKWIGTSAIGNGYDEYYNSYANMSDKCYSALHFSYAKVVPDQTLCNADNCINDWNSYRASNECYTSGIINVAKSIMESFYKFLSASDGKMENRRTFFDYTLLNATFASVIYPQKDGSNSYGTIGNFRYRDFYRVSEDFMAYPPPGIALKELIHGDFSFHHSGLSTPITLKIWNKAGDEVNFTANFDAVYEYVFKGFTYKIEDLKIGERYTVEVTWDGGGSSYNYKYMYYYVDLNTPPQLNPGCEFNPDYTPTILPTLPPKTEPPKPTSSGGKKIAFFSYDLRFYVFKKDSSRENIKINPSEKYDDVTFTSKCEGDKNIASVDENGTVTVVTSAIGISTCTITCSGTDYESYSSIIKFEIKEKIIPSFDPIKSVFPKFITPNKAFNVIAKIDPPDDISIMKYPIELTLTISHADFDNVEVKNSIKNDAFEVEFENIIIKSKDSFNKDVYVDISISGIDNEKNNLVRLKKSITVVYQNASNRCEKPDEDGLCCERNIKLGESCTSLLMIIPFTKVDNKFLEDFNNTFYETIIKENPFKHIMFAEEKNVTISVKYYSNLHKSKTVRLLDDYGIDWTKVKNPLKFVEVLVYKIQDDSIVLETSDIQEVLGIEDENIITIAALNQKLDDQSRILKYQVAGVFSENGVDIDPNAEIVKDDKNKNIDGDIIIIPNGGNNNGGGGKNDNNGSWAKDNWWAILIICVAVVVILGLAGVIVYAKSSKKETNKSAKRRTSPCVNQTRISVEEVKEEHGVDEKDIYKPFTSAVVHEGYLSVDGNKKYCVITFEPALFRTYDTMVTSTYGNVYLGEQEIISLSCYKGIVYKDNSNEFIINLKVKDKKVKCIEPGDVDMNITIKSCGGGNGDDNSIEDIKKWVESFRDFSHQVPHVVNAWTSSTALVYDKDGKLTSPKSQTIEKAVERAKQRKEAKTSNV